MPVPGPDLRPKVAYRLPDSLRKELGKPWGPVLSTDELAAELHPGDFVVAVGDVVSLTLKQFGFNPKLFVCDYQTQRGEANPEYERELGAWGHVALRVRNPAATITRQAWDAIRLALDRDADDEEDEPVRLVVEGEEDLLGIPCFLEAPLGSKVLYGMPGKGVVVVTTTTEFLDTVRKLLARFEQA